MVYYLLNTQFSSMRGIPGTPLGDAFVQAEYLIFGVICTISVTGTIALELLLDFFMEYGHTKVKDQGERLMMILVVILPGFLIIKYKHNPNIPYIFCCLHSIQVIGSAAPIFSLCCKLVPIYFTPGKALLCYLFWTAAGTFMFIGFHQPLKSWANLLVFVCVSISIGIFTGMVYSWGKELTTRVPPVSAKTYLIPKIFACLTEDEFYCIVYISCALFTIVMVPAMTGAVRLYKWEEWNHNDLCINIYALTGFSVISGIVPGRYRQHVARTNIAKKIQQNHDTVRYISHEIRSPLNIVQNGVKLVISNLTGHCHPEILQDLADIEHASCAATSIVDDLLNFEKLEANSFQVERRYEPAASMLTEITTRCHTLAQQKNIKFEIQNQLCCSDSGDTLFMLVDVIKMEQVIRNLIVNSIKFTPKGGSIIVSFRHETSSVLPRAGALSALPSSERFFERCPIFMALLKKIKGWWLNKQKIYAESEGNIIIKDSSSQATNDKKTVKAYCLFGTVCIDITDTGVGLSPSQLKDMFGKFVQFNANHLQGGGGSGLGLWICKSIVEQHEGIITLKSDGLGRGTTFTIRMNCYLDPVRSNTQSQHTIEMNSRHKVSGHSLQDGTACNLLSLTNTSSNKHKVTGFQSALKSIPSEEISHSSSGSDFSSLHRCSGPLELCILKAASSVHTLENKQSMSSPRIFSPINILVVDDSNMNRKILKNIIKQISLDLDKNYRNSCHFEVFEADDGTTALEMMKTHPFSLIIIDNIMTHMNGPEAVKQMRQLGYRGLIMGVTGNVAKTDIDDFITQGANAVLKKPVSIEMLFQVFVDLISQT